MEGSGLGSAGCVVDVHALRVSCVVGCYNAIATEHGRYGLSCMQKLWECTTSAESVYMACYSVIKVAGNPVFSRSTNLESKLIEFFVFVNF